MSARTAQDAVHAWLTDGTNGLNARLALYRTANGLTTADVPDVAQFDSGLHLPRTATGWPYSSVTAPSSGPEEYRNSRTNDHEVEFTVVVLAKNTNQTVRGAVLAVQYIVEVVVDMLWSIATGREGATLYDAANITQCVLSGVRYGVDEDANRGRDNYAASISLAVRTQRPFPQESY